MQELILRNLKLTIPAERVYAGLERLHELTKQDNFSDAHELGWHKFDPKKDAETAEMLGLLVTIWRAQQEGGVLPDDFDIDQEYARIALQRTQTQCQSQIAEPEGDCKNILKNNNSLRR